MLVPGRVSVPATLIFVSSLLYHDQCIIHYCTIHYCIITAAGVPPSSGRWGRRCCQPCAGEQLRRADCTLHYRHLVGHCGWTTVTQLGRSARPKVTRLVWLLHCHDGSCVCNQTDDATPCATYSSRPATILLDSKLVPVLWGSGTLNCVLLAFFILLHDLLCSEVCVFYPNSNDAITAYAILQVLSLGLQPTGHCSGWQQEAPLACADGRRGPAFPWWQHHSFAAARIRCT